MDKQIICPAIYRHFKNKYYATMGVATAVNHDKFNELLSIKNVKKFYAKHTGFVNREILIIRYRHKLYFNGNDGEMVIYKPLYDNHGAYAITTDMFTSKLDQDKYPGINQKYRFELVRY